MTRILIAAALLAALSSGASAQATATTVPVALSEWKVETKADTLKAGPVTFKITNGGQMTHGFYVRGPGVEKGAKDIAARESGSLTVTLRAGEYEIFCPMSDLSHKMAGMTKKITVVAAAAPAAKKP